MMRGRFLFSLVKSGITSKKDRAMNNITQTQPIRTAGSDLDAVSNVLRQKVLIVDDDPDFVDMTKLILCQAGFDVAGALSCNSALEKVSEIRPDVILLDLMMPQVDGFETYQRLAQISHAPVIVITASGNRENAVKSFSLGIEDYITKPFFNAEMVARVQAVLGRARVREQENTRAFPEIDLVINLDTGEVFRHGNFVRLVPREFAVLSILAQQAPRPAAYAAITEKLWGADTAKNRSHLKNIVFSLRQKLEEDPAIPKIIINYRSLGYQMITRQERAG
jgi:two-component system, OmpR family, response regulator VicR